MIMVHGTISIQIIFWQFEIHLIKLQMKVTTHGFTTLIEME